MGNQVANIITLIGGLIALLPAIGGVGWRLHSEFSKIDEQMEKIDKHMGKLDIAIKILAEKQGGETKELVNDALAVVRMKLDSGQADQARSALSIANKLMVEQEASTIPVGHEYFERAAKVYSAALSQPTGNIGLRDEAFVGSLRLAEYRSAIQGPYKPVGTVFNCPPGSGETPFVDAIGDKSKADRLVNGAKFINCPASLDGFTWRNVVWVNSHVSYSGGAVILENVAFVHCTFESVRNDNTEKLMQYAALDEKSLQIDPEFFNEFFKHS